MQGLIWKLEGLSVWATGVRCNGQDVWVEGLAIREGRTYEWRAQGTPLGVVVLTKSSSGREEQYSGPTYNVALEVASAVRRQS